MFIGQKIKVSFLNAISKVKKGRENNLAYLNALKNQEIQELDFKNRSYLNLSNTFTFLQ